jgi:hypothetical protein
VTERCICGTTAIVKVLGAFRSPKHVLHAGLADKQNASSKLVARQLTLKSGMADLRYAFGKHFIF